MYRYPTASSLYVRQLILIGVAVIGATAFVDRAYAGAWTEAKGASYSKLGFNYFMSDQMFDSSGDLQAYTNNGTTPISKFYDRDVTYYGEYGLLNDLTVFTSIPYKRLSSEQSTGTLTDSGIGDIDLGVRYNFYNGSKGVVSTQALYKYPHAYDKNDPVPLGNGQNDFELRMLYGNGSLYPFYYGVEVGYRWRAGDPSDEWKYLLEAGYTINPKFYARTKLDGTYSARNGTVGVDASGNPTLTNNYDLAKLELTAGYVISKSMNLEATVTPTPYGKNTAYGTTYQIAIIYMTRPSSQ
jgi:hypothetical protein